MFVYNNRSTCVIGIPVFVHRVSYGLSAFLCTLTDMCVYLCVCTCELVRWCVAFDLLLVFQIIKFSKTIFVRQSLYPSDEQPKWKHE